jgi:hypothetical protein
MMLKWSLLQKSMGAGGGVAEAGGGGEPVVGDCGVCGPEGGGGATGGTVGDELGLTSGLTGLGGDITTSCYKIG